jgi:peptide/nickel transport system ATP-binding protein
LPSLEKDVKRLSPIPGLMPDPADLPSGCKFHPRCPEAKEECKNYCPRAVEISPGHFVRCLKFSEKEGHADE